jgi:imidazole glycerol-phosphate synthase subunit HisH
VTGAAPSPTSGSEGRHRPLLAVLDYGIGNLRSAEKALTHVGADARLTAGHGLIADADAVVLPGVGAFGRCMKALRVAGLEQPTLDAVASGRPFLGICIGMQMLFDSS